ncbi:capsular polysaccharide synthesis protein [Labrenzia sp. 011]|uniref:capsular polysaccharide synthesis protein n=1 Tax=Labrenzia sp. 011 TaxID=2171494 RepID=UPI0014036949|nr:capsular polysaccharide synthesis protein [Labrenzia sp. 011]
MQLMLSGTAQKVYGKLKKTRVGKLLRGHTSPVLRPDLPKIIYVYWDKGIDTAPDLCRFCVESWRRQNPGWNVVVLDQSAAEKILPRSLFPRNIAIAHYADLLRIKLLADTGGVWVDATCLCTRPLDEWLGMIFTQTSFFAFHRPGRDRLISSWFLAAKPECLITSIWLENALAFWHGRKKLPRAYFWFHYMFEYSVLMSSGFRRAWKTVPKISAGPPHRFQRALVRQQFNSEDREIIKSMPVHKLCYKRDFSVSDVERAMGEIWSTSN